MKPKNNRVFCNDCQRTKILFSTKEEALRFLYFNREEILNQSHRSPVRVYYCKLCGGWHTTSREHENAYQTRGEKHAAIIEKFVTLETLIDDIQKETDDFLVVRKIRESRALFENLKKYRFEESHLYCKLMRKLARVDTNFCETETLNDCVITFKAFVDKSDSARHAKNIELSILMLDKALDVLNLMPSKGFDAEDYDKFKRKVQRRIVKLQNLL